MPIELNRVRVLDLSRVLAGPLAGMMLGDLGAEVIKVERPGVGDESRGWGPPFDAAGESAYFLCCNRNKLSVALDLDAEPDREVLGGLMAEADVVLENFRHGSLAARGLDPRDCLRRHPRLIWCTVSGFGALDARPGYDFVVQAECGWMAVTGEPDGDRRGPSISFRQVHPMPAHRTEQCGMMGWSGGPIFTGCSISRHSGVPG